MPHLHDFSELRELVATNATRARELRQEAREEEGDTRHYLKVEANDYGRETRYPHLALGYLRGRTIAQMESETTSPLNLPSAVAIISFARDAFLRGPDAESWPTEERTETTKIVPVPDDRGFLSKILGTPAPEPKMEVTAHVTELDPPGWDDFKAHVEADIKAWHARVLINHTMKVARRNAREVGGSESRSVA